MVTFVDLPTSAPEVPGFAIYTKLCFKSEEKANSYLKPVQNFGLCLGFNAINLQIFLMAKPRTSGLCICLSSYISYRHLKLSMATSEQMISPHYLKLFL